MLNSAPKTHAEGNKFCIYYTYKPTISNAQIHYQNKRAHMLQLIFIISLALLLPPSSIINGFPTLHTFMYKYCSTAKLDDSNRIFSDTRQSLLQQLLPLSSQFKFYRTAVVPDQQVPLWGQFQCRGDLTADECYTCVNSFSNISSNTWCADSLAARIQLSGCHIQYEADGSEIPGADLTHTTRGRESATGDGFEEAISAALAAVESGLTENPSGYCSVDVGGVYAAAQCAEGLSGCDCGECVAKAVGVAAEECAGCLSGDVYMDLCFLSFEFHAEGSPTNSNPGKRGRGIGSSGKLVAIAAGGVALVLIGFILLKKSFKKNDDF